MNYGRHAISDLLEGSRDLQFYLDARMNSEWLHDRNHGSASVFEGVDMRAYDYILDHWAKYGKVPPLEQFQLNYPAKVLRLDAAEDRLDKAEIVEFATHEARRLVVAEAATDVVDLHDEDKIDEAAAWITEASNRLEAGLNAPVPDDKEWVADNRPPVPEYPVDQLVGPLRNLVKSSSLPPALLGGASSPWTITGGVAPRIRACHSRLMPCHASQPGNFLAISLTSRFSSMALSVQLCQAMLSTDQYCLALPCLVSPCRSRLGYRREDRRELARAQLPAACAAAAGADRLG